MPLWKITDKGHSKAKEAKFKQENHSIESVLEEAEKHGLGLKRCRLPRLDISSRNYLL
jgi:hypothetical protein